MNLIEAIDAAADPETAKILSKYFQVKPGGYGEGDRFVGVKLSDLRRIVKPYADLPIPELHRALTSSVHEHRLAALVLMSNRARRAGPDVLAEITELYLGNTAYVNNWDLVDCSAPEIVGRYLLDKPRDLLPRLARSEDLWERRIAIVATHWFIRAGQSADTYRLAELLLDDEHDLIHKASGWMLREAGKRVDADELLRFLDEHAGRMPRTMLRYAIEHLPDGTRKHYLGFRRTI